MNKNDFWDSPKIISRAGKATDKNSHWRSIKNQSGNKQSFNFKGNDSQNTAKESDLLKQMSWSSREKIHELLLTKAKSDILEAKHKELHY